MSEITGFEIQTLRSEAEHATSRTRDSPQHWVLRVDGEETFLFLSNRRDRETNPELKKAAAVNTTLGPLPNIGMKRKELTKDIIMMISHWKKPLELVSIVYTQIFQRFNDNVTIWGEAYCQKQWIITVLLSSA